MQNRHSSHLQEVNRDLHKGFNILSYPTHERYQRNYENSPHTFFLYQQKGIKTWNEQYGKLPPNFILLDGSANQIKIDIKFDVILSQNKCGQIQISKQLQQVLGIPIISLDHTLPLPQWNPRQIDQLRQLGGDINVFISKYSVEQWGYSLDDPTVRVLPHGIPSNVFKPNKDDPLYHNDGKILSVVNCYESRGPLLGWDIYQRLTKDLPINAVGSDDTGKNFSRAAESIPDLVSKYNQSSLFINTSQISPIPMSVLEACSMACPVVSTNTCEIPNIFTNEREGFFSNNESYLQEKILWCLKNREEAMKLGENARNLILREFSVEKHLEEFDNILRELING